jgi:cytochrome c-type biogenesis protein CcmH/NrfF
LPLPLAHIGHYLWIFYLLPVVFVVLGILKTTLSERRRGEPADDEGTGPGED